MNQDRTALQGQALSALIEAANRVVELGVDWARDDDPHQLATMHQRFRDGRAAQRLVLQYMADGRVGVAYVLEGLPAAGAGDDDDGDGPLVVQLFQFVARKTPQH